MKPLIVKKCFVTNDNKQFCLATIHEDMVMFHNREKKLYDCEIVKAESTKFYIDDYSLLTQLDKDVCAISNTGFYIPQYGNYRCEVQLEQRAILPYFDDNFICLPSTEAIEYFVEVVSRLGLCRYFLENTIWLVPPNDRLKEVIESGNDIYLVRRILLNHCGRYVDDRIISASGLDITDIRSIQINQFDAFTIAFVEDIIMKETAFPERIMESYCSDFVDDKIEYAKHFTLTYGSREKEKALISLTMAMDKISKYSPEEYDNSVDVISRIMNLINILPTTKWNQSSTNQNSPKKTK